MFQNDDGFAGFALERSGQHPAHGWRCRPTSWACCSGSRAPGPALGAGW